VTLPRPLQLRFGARLIIDSERPISDAFFTCFANGCMADYEATPELIAKLNRGHTLQIKAINLAANEITLALPLRYVGQQLPEGERRSADGPEGVRGAAKEDPGGPSEA
jgi:invasion protein IalB